MRKVLSLTMLVLLILGCENRDLNEGEAFEPREIHEDISFSFNKIEVDGVEYLILEKDNNNPHEGFGFMAFRANTLIGKSDTLMAYLQTVNEMQVRMFAALSSRSIEDVRAENRELFEYYLSKESAQLDELSRTDLKSTDATLPSGLDQEPEE